VQLATSFHCAAGCQAGLLLRLEKTADGFKGVFVSISETPGAFAVTLDAQGRFVSKEPLERGGGTVRALAPPPPPGAPDATRAGGPARGGPARGGPARGGGGAAGRGGPPERSPYTRPEYVFRPGEWNTLEAILDTNILRSWLNDGPEAGVASGRVDDQIARYGRVGLYAGGSTAVRYRSIETKDVGRRVFPDEQVGTAFRLQRLNDFYDAWSATPADVNRDGVLDVVAGPRYFLGPDYRVSREIYVTRIYNPGTEYAGAAMNIAHDYTGDGFPDLVTSEGRSFVLYVNPGKELRRWDRYPAFANTAEVVAFHDVTRDGAPDVIVLNSGMVSIATINATAPTSPWTVHPISGPGYTVAAQHGLGGGDINGDGRVDVVTPYGWWEHPATGFASAWPYHPAAFGRWPRAGASPGGGELRVADFNGDGLNDVVASLEAHGWGLAWFEQKRSASGEISWAQHMIIDDLASKNPGGVAISEIHAITTADVDYGRRRRQTAVLTSRQLYGSGSPRRCRALRVPHGARQACTRRGDVRSAIGPQSIGGRFDGADERLEQRWGRRHSHGHKSRHIYFLGHREERCEEVATWQKSQSIVASSRRSPRWRSEQARFRRFPRGRRVHRRNATS
jgi:hypothetical protein